jgi:hypothetical protein
MSTLRAFAATVGVLALIYLSRATASQAVDLVEARSAWAQVFMVAVALWVVAASNFEWRKP